jgi:hypothetical protein
LPTIEVLKAKLKCREKMERSNSIFRDPLTAMDIIFCE